MNFGKRDLGLVLSESVGDADTLRFTKDSRYAILHDDSLSSTLSISLSLAEIELANTKALIGEY